MWDRDVKKSDSIFLRDSNNRRAARRRRQQVISILPAAVHADCAAIRIIPAWKCLLDFNPYTEMQTPGNVPIRNFLSPNNNKKDLDPGVYFAYHNVRIFCFGKKLLRGEINADFHTYQ